MNVYKNCPQFSNAKYCLRLIEKPDTQDLLKVYSDVDAVKLFNCDNCHGDDFYYTTFERMQQAVDFWVEAYANGWFVRWSVVDNANGSVIGTIEAFKRDAEDYFTDCALLRLDLRSDYEKSDEIESIMSLIAEPSLNLFGCSMVATKAIAKATERIAALNKLGFVCAKEKLVGHDGTQYGDYFVLRKNMVK